MIDSPVILDAAHAYVSKGFSILPCVGKKAAIKWEALCERRPTPADVNRWRDMGILHNIGIIGGAVSGNLVIVDLDGDEAVDRFSRSFPSLMDTYTVQSGSGHGLHLYLRSDILPASKRTSQPWGNVELRAHGCYVVAPPSIHPGTGNRYAVVNRVPIKRVMGLINLSQWIEGQNAAKPKPSVAPDEPMPAIVDRPKTSGANKRKRTQDQWKRYIGAVVDGEVARVKYAPKGGRNEALNLAAFQLGQMVALCDEDGIALRLLTLTEVESALLSAAAALISEDGEKAVMKTIRSGLVAGIKNPRG